MPPTDRATSSCRRLALVVVVVIVAAVAIVVATVQNSSRIEEGEGEIGGREIEEAE